MLLASNIPDYGMTCTTELQHQITSLIIQENITRVIETGSFLGLGTTKAVLKGLTQLGLDYKFISIEVNPSFYKQAKANNIGTQVQFINALSIPRSLEPINFTTEGLPDYVIIDHEDDKALENYKQEINFKVPDSMLSLAVELKPELVILDSVGHCGLIEFKYLMTLLPHHEFYLVLDDINHVKHYQTMLLVESMPEKFEILWRTEKDLSHQAAIIKVL